MVRAALNATQTLALRKAEEIGLFRKISPIEKEVPYENQ